MERMRARGGGGRNEQLRRGRATIAAAALCERAPARALANRVLADEHGGPDRGPVSGGCVDLLISNHVATVTAGCDCRSLT